MCSSKLLDHSSTDLLISRVYFSLVIASVLVAPHLKNSSDMALTNSALLSRTEQMRMSTALALDHVKLAGGEIREAARRCPSQQPRVTTRS